MQENISNLLRLRRPVSGTAQYLAYVCGAASMCHQKETAGSLYLPHSVVFRSLFQTPVFANTNSFLSVAAALEILISLSLFFFTTTKIHHRTWRWNSKICCFFFTHHAFSTILYIVGVGVCVAAEEYSKWLLESLLVLEPSSSATFRQTCSTQTKRYTVWIYCDLLCGC